MPSLGALGFAAPAALLALLALPLVWWLLRTTPPRPRRIVFPPIRFLLDLAATDDSPARTPPWLLLLRLMLAAALVLGAARPVFDRSRLDAPAVSGTVVAVIDNGWAAARNWSRIQAALARIIDQVDREGGALVMLPTAETGDDGAAEELRRLTPVEARVVAQALAPQPWPTDRMAAARRLDRLAARGALDDVRVIWLGDGLSEPGTDAATSAFVAALGRHGPVRLFAPRPGELPMILAPAGHSAPGADGVRRQADVVLKRTEAAATRATLLLGDQDGQALARQEVAFAPDATRAEIALELPPAWRARLARIEIVGEGHAGAVLLTDPRWRRASVGIARPAGTQAAQPLLSGAHYVARAIEPFAELRIGTLEQLLDSDPTMITLIDEGPIAAGLASRLRAFVDAGGVLLRFAGPMLAAGAVDTAEDDLLPVRLRGGDRATGGALSWARPGTLAPFADDGPFGGLPITEDIAVHRQVLADPGTEGAHAGWARLTDGTPLVTGREQGKGWLVLVHTSADPSWSSLPLSGLFVEMLRRIADLGTGGAAPGPPRPLTPVATLDGFGRLGVPPASARPVSADALASLVPGPRHPPGHYGDGGERRAINLSPALGAAQPLPADLAGRHAEPYGGLVAIDLRPWLIGAALVLTICDLAASLVLRGLIPAGAWRGGRRAGTAIGAALAALVAVAAAPTQAAPLATAVPPAALELRLAFVLTGDPAQDAVSRSGLEGLSAVLNERTAIELGSPAGVSLETDELVFYPLVYWPLAGTRPYPSAAAIERVKDYRRRGGTLVFDARTRGGGATATELRDLARGLDLPALTAVPDDHLLHRAYYLLAELPGRWVGDPVWVDATAPGVNDGVASVIAGGNDWAGAWAVDGRGRPSLPVVPGGEAQRELAYRFGVNLVMYVLTGSYKADQVHLPSILERLRR